ncbi:MAG: hypothetical protein GY869_24145, partial [Planctomycetes bacterium]|nr:hypothetical protein [Planctomycetota bacterium]
MMGRSTIWIFLVVILCALWVMVSPVWGDDLPVPSGAYPTIQSAINSATAGDRIIVQPGIYLENLTFYGIDIVLTSTDPGDPEVVAGTVIQGTGAGSVVTFGGSETSAFILSGFTITGGNIDTYGGGIYGNGTLATVERCVVRNNYSEIVGGGIHNCLGIIRQCIIKDNITGLNGGGLAGCHGMVVNCLIVDNQAGAVGGALNNSDGDFISCTVAGNTATSGGVFEGCDGSFSNCVVWGNSPAGSNNCTAGFDYCCLEWVEAGTGNINSDPGFLNTTDYRLGAGSPCIDAGQNSVVPVDIITDIIGLPRFLDDPGTVDTGDGTAPIVDMGANEYSIYPFITVPERVIEFFSLEGGENPDEQYLFIKNEGGGVLQWGIQESCGWLEVTPQNGSCTSETSKVTLMSDTTGMSKGQYQCDLEIADAQALNSPIIVTVILRVNSEYYVPSEYGTIQAAIDAAIDGDTIIVADGTYRGEGNRDIDFLGKAITVRSENGAEGCIIDCEGT